MPLAIVKEAFKSKQFRVSTEIQIQFEIQIQIQYSMYLEIKNEVQFTWHKE